MNSKKPSKSRKQQYNMPMHKKAKAIAGHLNEKLRKELNKRSVPLRKNDTVKILRGNYKGKTGKITKVDRSKMKIFIEKITRKKSDGTEYNVAIDPSKIIVIEIDKSDKKRFKNSKLKKAEKK